MDSRTLLCFSVIDGRLIISQENFLHLDFMGYTLQTHVDSRMSYNTRHEFCFTTLN
jgi:hypothetical protein